MIEFLIELTNNNEDNNNTVLNHNERRDEIESKLITLMQQSKLSGETTTRHISHSIYRVLSQLISNLISNQSTYEQREDLIITPLLAKYYCVLGNMFGVSMMCKIIATYYFKNGDFFVQWLTNKLKYKMDLFIFKAQYIQTTTPTPTKKRKIKKPHIGQRGATRRSSKNIKSNRNNKNNKNSKNRFGAANNGKYGATSFNMRGISKPITVTTSVVNVTSADTDENSNSNSNANSNSVATKENRRKGVGSRQSVQGGRGGGDVRTLEEDLYNKQDAIGKEILRLMLLIQNFLHDASTDIKVEFLSCTFGFGFLVFVLVNVNFIVNHVLFCFCFVLICFDRMCSYPTIYVYC